MSSASSLGGFFIRKITMIDNVNNPQHYKCKGVHLVLDIEPITILKDLPFCKGNAIKYILRYKNKNGLEDLKKAEYYIKADTTVVKPGNIETLVITEYLKKLLQSQKITKTEYKCIVDILINPEKAVADVNQLMAEYGTPLKEAVEDSLKHQEQKREFDPIEQLIKAYKDFIE